MAGPTLRRRLPKSRPGSQTARPRAARQHVSYHIQSSSDTGDDLSDQEGPINIQPARSRHQRRSPPPRQSGTASSRKRKAADPGHHRPANVKRPKNVHSIADRREDGTAAIQWTGRKMPWDTLPYHILADIFFYASRPLLDKSCRPLPSIHWLCQMARCCKAFTEPALSALYYSPPLSPPTRAYGLIEHLLSQSATATLNYRTKIKYIEIEAYSTLMHKIAGQEPIDVGELVMHSPQLRGIEIRSIFDDPRLRRIEQPHMVGGRTVYQQSMFTALRNQNIALQEWTWNQYLTERSVPLTGLRAVHETAPFHNLRKISFVNYDGTRSEKGKQREIVFAEALSVLRNLKSLSFRTSRILTNRMMLLLPSGLEVLEIVNCRSVVSTDLHGFLLSSGGSLRQLVLDHNNSLSLSFLTDLSTTCPNLQFLKMDLRFTDLRDWEFNFAEFLREGEIPTWPSSLRCVEIYHLRKWSLRTAESFFSSLINAARGLSDLRQLKIKASIEASGWRDRIGFRDQWTDRLTQVFLRQSASPNPAFQSISSFKVWKQQQLRNAKHKGRNPDRHTEQGLPGTKIPSGKGRDLVVRVQINANNPIAEESDSDAPLVNIRRHDSDETGSGTPLRETRRITRARAAMGNKNLSSEKIPQAPRSRRRRRNRKSSSDSSSEEDSALDDISPASPSKPIPVDEEIDIYIQGLCDVVEVLIDNLRPTQEQLREDDFLDDEVSGDEDWNEDDDIPDDEGGYAW